MEVSGERHIQVGSTSPPSRTTLMSWWKHLRQRPPAVPPLTLKQAASSASAAPKGTRPADPCPDPSLTAAGVFGVPLSESIAYANVAISVMDANTKQLVLYGHIPIVMAKCGVFLKESATDVEGIFRLSGSVKRVKELQSAFDVPPSYGRYHVWDGYTVHDAASVFRRFIDRLPEPVIPHDSYHDFRATLTSPEYPTLADKIARYQTLVIGLAPVNRQLLLYVLDLMALFASNSEVNRMTAPNLAAIFQPGILSHPDHDMSPDEYRMSQSVLVFLIEQQRHFLFGMPGSEGVDSALSTPDPAASEHVAPPAVAAAAVAAAATTSLTRRQTVRVTSSGAHSTTSTLSTTTASTGTASQNVNANGQPRRPKSTTRSLSNLSRSNSLPSHAADVGVAHTRKRDKRNRATSRQGSAEVVPAAGAAGASEPATAPQPPDVRVNEDNGDKDVDAGTPSPAAHAGSGESLEASRRTHEAASNSYQRSRSGTAGSGTSYLELAPTQLDSVLEQPQGPVRGTVPAASPTFLHSGSRQSSAQSIARSLSSAGSQQARGAGAGGLDRAQRTLSPVPHDLREGLRSPSPMGRLGAWIRRKRSERGSLSSSASHRSFE